MTQNTVTERLLPFVNQQADENSEKEEALAMAEALLEEKKAQRLRAFTKENLFGEGGTFRELPKDEQRELLAVVLTFLEEETEKYIDGIGQYSNGIFGDRFPDGISWEQANLEPRMKHLLEAAKNDIFLSDWKKRVTSIERATHYYPPIYSEKVIRWKCEKIQETAVKIEQMLGETPEGLTGSGLEFVPSSIGGGQKVYLNGQFVTTTVNARFSDSPTNGEVVAWLVVEQIDYCNIRGAQISCKVFAWKNGLEEPEQVFEDHAYSSERSFSVDAPKVSKDGKVIVSTRVNGEESTREVSVTR
ncbi:hypothetical protein MYX06_03075 [Patescibacteria group bacterium AH-259-L05]|nr:hypothetical protein [Patescibacteria group bacterium AH-259-L05]